MKFKTKNILLVATTLFVYHSVLATESKQQASREPASVAPYEAYNKLSEQLNESQKDLLQTIANTQYQISKGNTHVAGIVTQIKDFASGGSSSCEKDADCGVANLGSSCSLEQVVFSKKNSFAKTIQALHQTYNTIRGDINTLQPVPACAIAFNPKKPFCNDKNCRLK